MRKLILLLAILAVCSCHKQSPYSPLPDPDPAIVDDATVGGRVSCGGQGVAGVVVSDGVTVTVTDKDGRYRMKSDKKHGYVFISIPSGYEVESDGVIPRFFERLNGTSAFELVDFKLTPVDQSKCNILFFGDMHLANRTFCHDISQFREFTVDVNSVLAGSRCSTYAITLGDMSWDVYWSSNKYDLQCYLKEVNSDFHGLQIFHTMGNHDNDPTLAGDFLGESAYKSLIGPTYYSFNIGGIHYIVLDDVMYRNQGGERDFYREVSGEQITWMVQDLKHVSKDTPVFVTMHCPLYKDNGDSSLYNLWDLIKNFEGYDHVHFVTGHTHAIYNVDCLGRSVHVYENNSGAVCGAWWMTGLNRPGTHIGPDGAPGGYRILSVSDGKFTWQYKGTGLPLDEQFRAYDMGEGEMYVNVWDYDPKWTVSVTENGKKLKVNRLENAKDPLYLEVYEKYQKDHGYNVSFPAYETNHIFGVKASRPDAELKISVTDRFGRTYSKDFTLRP